jgi:sulfopyruvate decarboxylase TPP-binding subunit
MPDGLLPGGVVIDAIKQSGVEFILSVPDITTAHGLLMPIAADPGFKLVRVCKEDEAVGISAGLSYADRRALVLIQHTGLLDSINAVRAVAVEYRLPVCMMVGLLNAEPGIDPNESKVYGIRIVKPILDAMGVRHVTVDVAVDADRIAPAIERAYIESEPVVILISRSPTP